MTHPDIPAIRLRPNKPAQRLRFGFPWVYANELVLDRRTKTIPAGTIVNLCDTDNSYIATCAFNAQSKISLRLLSQDENVTIDRDWLRQKLVFAAQLRDRLFDKPFYRLIHAEADGLPGVIIDRFGDAAVIQPNAAWAEQRIDWFTEILQADLGITAIVKNAQGRARVAEGLDTENVILAGKVEDLIEVPMNGATYMADLMGGQKTGLFYDQRPNHAFTAQLAKDARILDVFSHVGGFSLASLANGAKSALAVDASQPALDLAIKGAELSGFAKQFETRKGDAFAVLAALKEEGQKFDLVVCDPPAFAPNKDALSAGLRAYERTAKLAAALVKPGGYLVVCSCSHAVDLARFRLASLIGVGKAGRTAQVLHTGFAGPDHPTHAHLGESAYLKSLFFRLD
ncbi:MAG: RlmI/RlmK family 23S rRNA methyltransferase [Rhodobacteraceae bacterium]|nr:MAG: RlmI/RlmK family 23S rRNA methyltransferase [Paracoccaceae bacterium]